MLYREVPKTGDKLSILGFGCMRLPGGRFGIDAKKAVDQIRYAVDRGINYLDTAWPYHNGKSEVILAKALKDGYREKVKIADKLPHWLCKSREDMDYYLDNQLERLEDKVIDYYLIHSLDKQSWERVKALGVIDFMDRARERGKIVNAGFSFHGARDDFKEIIDGYDWDFCQIQFNILDEHNQAGIEGLEYAASKNIGVMVMEPLRGGTLAGKLPDEVERIYKAAPVKRTNVEWALRWIWNHPGIVTVLSGMNEISQIDDNIRIAGEAKAGSLTDEELRVVKNAGESFRKVMKVPCTGCQYCMPCPKDVNIPFSFSFYNNKYIFKQGFLSRLMYLAQLGPLQGRKAMLASQCVECGKCMKHCPQHINIPDELKKVKREFEGFFTRPLMFLVNRMLSVGSRKDKSASFKDKA
ncbi:MAG: aldo/keto reductase [Candidatus Omnitrophica bacterium]|nr:aldo/keto reductase [Candidatus Omnitrophota bacterium]